MVDSSFSWNGVTSQVGFGPPLLQQSHQETMLTGQKSSAKVRDDNTSTVKKKSNNKSIENSVLPFCESK